MVLELKQGTQNTAITAGTLKQHAFLFCGVIKRVITNSKQHLVRTEPRSMIR